MKKCQGCAYGPYPDPSSDICHGCRNDPDTGWGGFTDHSIGQHFYNEEERRKWKDDHLRDSKD